MSIAEIRIGSSRFLIRFFSSFFRDVLEWTVDIAIFIALPVTIPLAKSSLCFQFVFQFCVALSAQLYHYPRSDVHVINRNCLGHTYI
jgi:hypothetical protein